VNDDKGNTGRHPEEILWEAVWANSEIEALAIAATHYPGDREGVHTDTLQVVHDRELPPTYRWTGWPRIERDRLVLREIGWHEAGEAACEVCKKYANGLARYDVCASCGRCKDCGCECATPKKPNQENQ
jgi:hypothetical protein